MKKQYIQPTLEAITVKNNAILMVSTLGVASGTLDADKALGRGVFWEDEDDEDFE